MIGYLFEKLLQLYSMYYITEITIETPINICIYYKQTYSKAYVETS